MKKYVNDFLNRNWCLSSLNDLLKKNDRISTVDRKPGSGFNTLIAHNVDAVEEIVLSRKMHETLTGRIRTCIPVRGGGGGHIEHQL